MNKKKISKKNLMTAGWFTTAASLLAGLLLCAGQVAGGEVAMTEYQVKALFLFNFAKYVDWPAATFTNATAPITIGVLGDDPFGDNLPHAVDGKIINGRSFVIKHLAAEADLSGCQILFISDSEASRMEEILGRAGALPILTVGEGESFAKKNGIIHFVLKEGKVRLEIDLAAAKKSGLIISSKLLAVADMVKGKNN